MTPISRVVPGGDHSARGPCRERRLRGPSLCHRGEAGMSGYVVSVEFEIRPDAFAAFKKLTVENARASVRDEPGCRQFDVCAPVDGAPRVVLYEIYDDEGAF